MFETYQHAPLRYTSESAVCFCKSILPINLLCSFNCQLHVYKLHNYNLLCRKEPLKRKKRLDPQIARARIERKRRKIEKQIRKLQKVAKQLKPISEVEIPLKLIDEKE